MDRKMHIYKESSALRFLTCRNFCDKEQPFVRLVIVRVAERFGSGAVTCWAEK